MRVAHIVEAMTGGVLTYMRTVLPRLVGAGAEVALFCSLERKGTGAEASVAEMRDGGVRVSVIPMQRRIAPWADLRAGVQIRRALVAGAYDVIHTHASKAGVLGRIAARATGTPAIVHTPHCFAFLRFDGWRKVLSMSLERGLGRLTHRCVCVSADEAHVAMKRRIVSPSRCVHLDNACSDLPSACSSEPTQTPAAFKRHLGIRPTASVVTTVCRLVEYKGVLTFLDAAAVCASPDAVFLIAGEGELASVAQAWIARRRLGDRIRLLGHVDVRPLLRATDVMVLCSRAEGQPYAIIEAMRAGRAIVATDVPGNRSLVAHGRTGLLTTSRAGSIASAIDQLLGDNATRGAYGRAARDRFRRRHVVDRQVRELMALYGRCLRGVPEARQ